ncbi:unnamed protein product [Strongylus vulgaris]|uniref:Peptidase M14 carboxypeptidase A domain-containing protein n=1 Tax=Strongylus vulgaris TaxID=40348 RepID=A0A3P7LKW0_STRVU|nr:unnamed protein product [Strongylus vulgaris]
MQDWQYINTNLLEITVEMGCYKFPTNDMMPKMWEEHKYALLSFLEMANTGVYGLVLDPNGKPALNATVAVEQGKLITATDLGEFWRMLSPGKHRLVVEAPGFESDMFEVTIGHEAVRHDFKLNVCGTRYGNETVYLRGNGNIRIAVIGISPRLFLIEWSFVMTIIKPF